MYLDKFQFVLGADLETYAANNDYFSDRDPCNIYFVLRRPKVTVDPDSINVRGKKVRFKVLIHLPEKIFELGLHCEFKRATSRIECHTEYPYNLMLFKDQEKPLMLARPGTLIDGNWLIGNPQSEELDYEILYIGQAFGKNGKRTALDRLASHQTVQKIYTHALTQFPESDIWIMLTRFAQVGVMVAAGSALVNVNPADKKIENKKVKHFLENEGMLLTERQKINLTEAALINYFEPEYNVNFKEIFPSTQHKSYSDCYKLDVRAINIEVGTHEHIRKIFTRKSGRKVHHSKLFEFGSKDERMSFLDFKDFQY